MLTGRFAPSPSGDLHAGSLVAALASRCDALSGGGQWLLRIDDIDPPRTRPTALESIPRTLAAFGLHWHGAIWYQSRRRVQYGAALRALQQSGQLFRCACTRRQTGSDGRCLRDCRRQTATPSDCTLDAQARAEAGFALRFALYGSLHYHDRIQGPQAVELARDTGDVVCRRRDGLVAYALACAVDDSEGISDVVRGVDLQSSTPAQIALMRVLDRPEPVYAHVPLACDAAGLKLGKRTKAPALNASTALSSLMQAWRHLGQRFEHPDRIDSLDSFWEQALASWAIERVAGVAGA